MGGLDADVGYVRLEGLPFILMVPMHVVKAPGKAADRAGGECDDRKSSQHGVSLPLAAMPVPVEEASAARLDGIRDTRALPVVEQVVNFSEGVRGVAFDASDRFCVLRNRGVQRGSIEGRRSKRFGDVFERTA